MIFVAAGVLSYGVHDLQETRFLPGLNSLAFNVSGSVDASNWWATVLKAVFNFSPQTTWLEAIAWTSYVVITLTFSVRSARGRTPTPAPPASIPVP